MAEPQAKSRDGFRVLPNGAFFDPRARDMTAEAYRVLAAVEFYDRNGKNGRHCDASLSAIAKLSQCNTSTVRRWLAKLADMAFIAVVESGKRGRGNSNVYKVNWDNDAPSNAKLGSAAPFSDNKTVQPEQENSAAEALKVFSAEINTEGNQSGIEGKETEGDVEGYNAKRYKETSRERAPLLQSGVWLNEVAQLAVDRFGSKAEKFIDERGTFNVCGFLTWQDREGQRKRLSAQEIENLLDVADAAVGYYDKMTDECGLAYRISVDGGWSYTNEADAEERA